jgi:polyphosphate kinase
MYKNRDISWLGFNHRVLKEAQDKSHPLLERVRFLSIFSSNLDEFFRVRFPIVNAYSKLPTKLREKIIPPPDADLIEKVQEVIDGQLNHFGQILYDDLLPELRANNIHLYYQQDIPESFRPELKEFFYSKVLSFLQPIFIRKSLQEDFFPESNLKYFLVSLKRPGEEAMSHAFLNIPARKVGRFYSIMQDDRQHIFFLDDIIRDNLNYIFSRYEVKSCYTFKITRDAELNLDEENIKGNILDEMEKKLAIRENGLPSRLLYEKGMPLALQKLMSQSFLLTDKQMFEGGRYHNLSDLDQLPIKRSDLLFKPIVPVKHAQLCDYGDMFEQITKGDILLHFPYQSYNPVLSFFNQAAIDPNVKAIYATLYRVASESHIANALISAAKNKKEVTVFVELKARFDEANNIRWSKAMKNAGVKIVYSIPGIKVHSKIALIKTKKAGDLDYAFIGTGNFNENTARFYTDHALLTSNKKLTRDLDLLFNILEKGKMLEKNNDAKFDKLFVAHSNMVEAFEKEIGNQIKRSKKGLPATIKLKVNNLEDISMIDWLYRASQAGVKVDLLVRSTCCLVPRKAGLSDNIRVKRIVDRYLEHSRIFIFGSGEDRKVYIGSADWMTRNLYKRVEVVVPILNGAIANELEDYFDIQWNDNVKGRELDEALNEIIGNNDIGDDMSSQNKIYQYLQQKTEVKNEVLIAVE